MQEEIADYLGQYHNLKAIGSAKNTRKPGTLNIVSSTGAGEMTETSEFQLEHFHQAVLPALGNPSDYIFVEIGPQIFVYQLGNFENPEFLLSGGKSGSRINGIHFVCENLNLEKCSYIIDQFRNLKEVTFDILGFGEEAQQPLNPNSFCHGQVHKLAIKTHQSIYKRLNKEQMAAYINNCVAFLKKCEAAFSGLFKIDLELPLNPAVHTSVNSLLSKRRILSKSFYISGAEREKIICFAPVTPADRRRLNPGLAKLICVNTDPVPAQKGSVDPMSLLKALNRLGIQPPTITPCIPVCAIQDQDKPESMSANSKESLSSDEHKVVNESSVKPQQFTEPQSKDQETAELPDEMQKAAESSEQHQEIPVSFEDSLKITESSVINQELAASADNKKENLAFLSNLLETTQSEQSQDTNQENMDSSNESPASNETMDMLAFDVILEILKSSDKNLELAIFRYNEYEIPTSSQHIPELEECNENNEENSDFFAKNQETPEISPEKQEIVEFSDKNEAMAMNKPPNEDKQSA